MANAYGYTPQFLLSNSPWAWDVEECFKRCTHGVPKEVIQRMKDTFEPDDTYPTLKV